MSRLSRLYKIISVFSRHRLDTYIELDKLPCRLRWPLRIAPWRLLPTGSSSRGERLRQALEELGPVFIKFGQMLSTRRDLLPEDIADELEKLQDEVPPFDEALAVAIIEQALGAPVGELFAEFAIEPLASASVAQVHAATLKTGERVVVKVLRPGIEAIIRQDLALMYTLARLLHRHFPDGHRLRPVEVVSDYEITILDELDLQREAANASQLKRNFEGSDLVRIPEVHWDFTRRNVFVMERISGIPVTDLEELRARGTDLKLLAERGVEIFFTQVFRDNFFHADMHPGNIFVDASDPADPKYIAIDCAIIGTLSDFDQYYLARNLLAIFHRDYRECAQLHVECGWVPPGTKVHEFESAMRTVCEPVFEKPIAEISFGQLLIYLFQTARRFNMEVQPSLVLLQKTLLNIEGLGRQIYPQLDLWTTAQPYLENWIQQRYSPQGLLERLRRNAPSWLEQLPQLPDALLHSLQHSGELETQTQQQRQRLERLQVQVQREDSQRKRMVVAVLLFGGAAATAFPEGIQQMAQWPLLSWGLLGIGLYLLWPRSQP
ncbi:MAG: ubiquinone biosynthesis regulatory protein kinase UbiB [Gammaproteobacteria bacterium]|nr:ubiquinone biosynthesis regulatory protein kinase UbiB [Gammaproteobacteria bacterium]